MPAIVGGRALIAGALAAVLAAVALAGLGALAAVGQSAAGCTAAAVAPPSTEADATIPPGLMPIFARAEAAYGVPWSVLAAINKVETDFGRNQGPSPAGAVGWMQFLPATWARYGIDADGDGRADPADPADAIFTAAAYLRAAGAPGYLRRALLTYPRRLVRHRGPRLGAALHRGRRVWRCHRRRRCVRRRRSRKRPRGPDRTGSQPARPPAHPQTLSFLARVAVLYGRPIVVTTGHQPPALHHRRLGLRPCRRPRRPPRHDPQRRQRRLTRRRPHQHDGLRIQCIWKTDEGGDHHHHVHVGARPE
jgi:hypothetical protein